MRRAPFDENDPLAQVNLGDYSNLKEIPLFGPADQVSSFVVAECGQGVVHCLHAP